MTIITTSHGTRWHVGDAASIARTRVDMRQRTNQRFSSTGCFAVPWDRAAREETETARDFARECDDRETRGNPHA